LLFSVVGAHRNFDNSTALPAAQAGISSDLPDRFDEAVVFQSASRNRDSVFHLSSFIFHLSSFIFHLSSFILSVRFDFIVMLSYII